jgi:putative photosynthetic complex assembly protein
MMRQPAGHTASPRPALFARAQLLGVAALILLVVGGVGLARYMGAGAPAIPAGEPLLARSLSFDDRPDGSIVVRDAVAGDQITLIEPGSNGFIRGTLRALVRERRQHDFGRETAFRLAAWPDGRLTLTDPNNGRMLGLEAFGSTNRDAFARLLTAKEGAP